MTDAALQTGFLWRDGDEIRGTITDAWGYITHIVGVPAVRDGVRGYELTAHVEVPVDLKLAFLDEPDVLPP